MGESVATIGAKRAGLCYQVSDCDFAILVKAIQAGLAGMMRDLKVEMLRTIELFPGSFADRPRWALLII